MIRNILVFGGTGVIGTELIKSFKEKGHFVANISRVNVSPYADVNYLIDLSYCVGVNTDIEWDEIFMLSSYSTSDKMNLTYLEKERENIKYLLKNNPKSRFYYMSSYAAKDNSIYPTDSIKYQYRHSKQSAEKLLEVMSAKGYNVHALRIPAVYGGENNNRSIYRIVDRLKQDLPIVIKGDSKVCYIEDIVEFYDTYMNSIRSWNAKTVDTLRSTNINLSKVVLHLKEKLKSNSIITVELSDDEIDIVNEVLSSEV